MSVKLPPSGQKCERTIIPKERFHQSSFRWAHKGPIHILIACPKTVQRGSRTVATRWDEKAPVRQQCKLATGKGKVTMLAHNLVVPAQGGQCRPNYKLK